MRSLLIGSALLVLVACGASRNEGTNPPVFITGERTEVRWNGVSIVDDGIAAKLAVQSSDSRRSETGTLEVWAHLRNRTDHALQIEGRVQFFDSEKRPIEGPSAWKRMYLDPNTMATFSEFSTRADGVAYYYIELREGR